MNSFNRVGNPVLDKQDADERMEMIKPFVESKGFEQLTNNSHTFYNKERNIAIIFSSCPSNSQEYRVMKDKIKSLKDMFDFIKPYIIYHRPKAEWIDKEAYTTALKRIKKLGGAWYSHKGVLCLDNVSDLTKHWKFFIDKGREII